MGPLWGSYQRLARSWLTVVPWRGVCTVRRRHGFVPMGVLIKFYFHPLLSSSVVIRPDRIILETCWSRWGLSRIYGTHLDPYQWDLISILVGSKMCVLRWSKNEVQNHTPIGGWSKKGVKRGPKTSFLGVQSLHTIIYTPHFGPFLDLRRNSFRPLQKVQKWSKMGQKGVQKRVKNGPPFDPNTIVVVS